MRGEFGLSRFDTFGDRLSEGAPGLWEAVPPRGQVRRRTRAGRPRRDRGPVREGRRLRVSDVSAFQGDNQRARTQDAGVTGHPTRPSASSSLSASSSPPTSSGRPAYPSSVWFSPVASPPRRYPSTRPAGSWLSVCWGNRRSTRRARDPNRPNDCASMLRSGLPFGSV